MNSILKKIVFVIAFVLVALVVPTFLLLTFVDTTSNFSAYIIVFGVIIFAIFGYVIATVHSMEEKLEDALEDLKMQNAAIAYKISNTDVDAEKVNPVIEPEIKAEPAVNVPLNPADPLVMPGEQKNEPIKKIVKVVDDNFDDFK